MMEISDLIDVIENIAPLAGAAAWDVSGMQVAARRTEVSRMALCLDPSPASVATALAQGAECIVSHHPLLMQARMPSRLDGYHQVLSALFQADVPLYAAHTSLDVNPDGPAGWLAQSLGLRQCTVLEPTGTHANGSVQGFGMLGQLPTPCSLPELLQKMGQDIDLSTATQCGPVPAHIAKVAYCTGSGSSLLHGAMAASADVFITGDIKYHTALEAGLCILDVGHHSLEEEMMRRFALFLARQLPQMVVDFVPSVSPLRPALAL